VGHRHAAMHCVTSRKSRLFNNLTTSAVLAELCALLSAILVCLFSNATKTAIQWFGFAVISLQDITRK